ncbi:TIGR03617 family F420-dependent LLM class oxidoreductase [Sporichthya polymorpha]|uniref:TIGR03617 family F420-dependent LLM class oxidoreductase n=1 Tax=Sporichthya polymorpha TaxID=35751 RepID=UPI00037BC65D|nr:TIGR03617 family F420-dependent LLM class oxidoreductase [Sporichthya polymorpha]
MQIDVMVRPTQWDMISDLARRLDGSGFTGMTFTDVGATPWISIAAAAMAAPTLTFTTGIAVAFPMSPMIAAMTAWELAGNTGGRFRLGLGSQVKAHVERRYGVPFDPPGPRLRDYLLAVQDILATFRGERELDHHSRYYDLNFLPPTFRPEPHEHGQIKVDVSAVGPWMARMAGEYADGLHVHPLHSLPYLHNRLVPAVRIGEEAAERAPGTVDLLVPVFIVPGDTTEEREALTARTRRQIAFYGSTLNYAFQFDDLGFEGTSENLHHLLRAGDTASMTALITDEMLEHFALIGPWDSIADTLVARYGGVAERVISYLTVEDLARNPENLGRWTEIARAVRSTPRQPSQSEPPTGLACAP